MAFIHEPVTPIVPNTTMEKIYNDSGRFIQYGIGPCNGYAMHDINYDQPIYDEETMEEIGVLLGYRTTDGTVGANYDWTPVEMLDEAGNTVTAYGDRQFFCKPIDEVPADQIFGVTNPPEIM